MGNELDLSVNGIHPSNYFGNAGQIEHFRFH